HAGCRWDVGNGHTRLHPPSIWCDAADPRWNRYSVLNVMGMERCLLLCYRPGKSPCPRSGSGNRPDRRLLGWRGRSRVVRLGRFGLFLWPCLASDRPLVIAGQYLYMAWATLGHPAGRPRPCSAVWLSEWRLSGSVPFCGWLGLIHLVVGFILAVGRS